MIIAGIIAEYNPFHLGHAYHVQMTRARTGADYVVAVMDGAFTQRGECAMMDKFVRARMALASGVDAVFELPALFAVRPAEQFAQGGIAILDGLGVDVVSYGLDVADEGLPARLAQAEADEPAVVSCRIRREMGAGVSHARARGVALAEYLQVPPETLSRPNLILAAEYLRAIIRLQARIRPLAIPRRGDYHETTLSANSLPSAGAVRQAVAAGKMEEALAAIPPEAREILAAEFPDGLSDAARLDDMLLLRLRALGRTGLAGISGADEGLEARVARLCERTDTRGGLLEAVKCKRYTHARISRFLAAALIGMEKGLTEQIPQPEYARLLSFRPQARPLLTELSHRARLPLVADPRRLRGDPCFALEMRATDLWGLTTARPEYRISARDLLARRG